MLWSQLGREDALNSDNTGGFRERTRSEGCVRVQGNHRDNALSEAIKQIVTTPQPAGSREEATSEQRREHHVEWRPSFDGGRRGKPIGRKLGD